ncbi:MAG: hypothetical protein LBM70_05715 [Victivallales bacterium]|jgi:hypothetical protein|nr:hypothetical protein [Victivallales bacterium]
MELIYWLIPVVGVWCIFVVVPVFLLATLSIAIVADKMWLIAVSVGYFIIYVFYFEAIVALNFIYSTNAFQWLLFSLAFMAFGGSIPYIVVLCTNLKKQDRWTLRAGILGVAATILAASGILMFDYSYDYIDYAVSRKTIQLDGR